MIGRVFDEAARAWRGESDDSCWHEHRRLFNHAGTSSRTRKFEATQKSYDPDRFLPERMKTQGLARLRALLGRTAQLHRTGVRHERDEDDPRAHHSQVRVEC